MPFIHIEETLYIGGAPHQNQAKKNKCPPQNEFLLQVSTKIRFGGTIKS